MSALMYLDIESRSQVDLKKNGLARYAHDPSTQVICIAWALGAGPIRIWFAEDGEFFPAQIIKHIKSGGKLLAWNSGFEKAMFDFVISKAFNFDPPDVAQWRCAMVASMTSGYPAGLGDAARALGLEQQKMANGARLIRQYCAPGHQVKWQGEDRLLMSDYCEADVSTMREAFQCFRPLTEYEWREHAITQRMNDKGIPVDVDFAEAALEYSDELAEAANDEIMKLTGGAMTRHTQRKARDAFLFPKLTAAQKGLLVVYKKGEKKISLDQDHRCLLLDCEDLDPDAWKLLTFINDAGSSALKKYNVINETQINGVVHNTLVFNGAQTGRFSSRGLQIHNIRRDTFEPDKAARLISNTIAGYELNNPGHTLGRLLRGVIKHDAGLYWVDYSGIEARVAPWLADDQDGEKILAIHRRGDDLYIASAAVMAGISIDDVTPDLRQAGKIAVLACGYAGGIGALQSMAKNYGLAFSDDRAEKIVNEWRDTNQWAVNLWAAFDEAVVGAVQYPGETYHAGRCALQSDGGNYLWCALPSGRMLAYPKPRWEQYNTPWGTREGPTHQLNLRTAVGQPSHRKHTRGANIMQNVTQAVAADLLRESLIKADEAGLDIRFSVHDECVGVGGVEDGERLNAIMLDAPAWAAGLPLSTSGVRTGSRWGK
jgi:DNA polymerase